MSIEYSPKTVTDGLVVHIDPANLTKHGASPYTNLTNNDAVITNSNFTEVDNILRSNVSPVTGSGTSEILITNVSIDTGSLTFQYFMKVTSDPNVGTNNNWRTITANLNNGRNPWGFVLEMSYSINYSMTIGATQYRRLNGTSIPTASILNTWQMHTFTYNQSSGEGAAYVNDALINSGLMSDSANLIFSGPGDAMNTLLTSDTMTISNSNPTDNVNGNGCVPADFGPVRIYNRALTADEIKQNFNATRSRYGV